MSRDRADIIRKMVVSSKGREYVNRQLKNEIKKYSKEVFGNAGYWHWLVLYSELREDFKKGWIPIDYYRFNFLPRVNPEKFMRISETKTMDHKTFNGFIIQPIVLRINDIFYDPDLKQIDEKEAYLRLKNLEDEVVIKPDNGRQGQGVIFKAPDRINFYTLPKNTDLVFQRKVYQHESIEKIHTHSVNTFRVLSFINKKGEIEIKFIILRFGAGGKRVDNMNAGGGWLYIYPDGKGATEAYNKYGISIGDKHPDTGVKFSSLKFPYYEKISCFCRKAHEKFPYTKVIGWDVYLDKDGEPNLIEWNANNPTIDVVEAHYGPFFKPEEIM